MCVNVGECVHVSSGALGSQRKVLRVLELHLQQVNIHPLRDRISYWPGAHQ